MKGRMIHDFNLEIDSQRFPKFLTDLQNGFVIRFGGHKRRQLEPVLISCLCQKLLRLFQRALIKQFLGCFVFG